MTTAISIAGDRIESPLQLVYCGRNLHVKPNIKDLSFKELTAFLIEHHHPAYRAKQVWQWLFQKRATTFAEMTNLSRPLREQIGRKL